MGWNYETGREETDAYTVMSGPLLTPKPGMTLEGAKNIEKVRIKIHLWENAESWLKSNKWRNDPERGKREVMKAWRDAEMAITGWDDRSQADSFRRGYLEWLAKGNQVADQVGLSDLEVDQLPLLERVVARGYRELAKTEHPDTGGTAERFSALRTAKLQLDRMMAEVGEILRS